MQARHGLAWLGIGVAALLWSSAATADIETFYKTDICPDFGGLKPPIAFEVGEMEAVQDNAFVFGGVGSGGTGGHYCSLYSLPKIALGMGFKEFSVGNASVVMNPADYADLGFPGAPWLCVVCQYEDKVAAHPALSTFGTALLMGGLVTALLVELRKRQVGTGA
jgi:hypothetical protein